jgi:hypothetical protein
MRKGIQRHECADLSGVKTSLVSMLPLCVALRSLSFLCEQPYLVGPFYYSIRSSNIFHRDLMLPINDLCCKLFLRLREVFKSCLQASHNLINLLMGTIS